MCPCFSIYNYSSPKRDAIESLFEKVAYDPKKLENYGLHYWFQERESVFFFSEKGAVSNFF
jgi:hypothetical protein